MDFLTAKLKELGLNFSLEELAAAMQELDLTPENISEDDAEILIDVLKQKWGGLAIRNSSGVESYEGEITPDAATLLDIVTKESEVYSDWLADQITAIMAGTHEAAINKAKQRGASNPDNFRERYTGKVKELFRASK